jgi:hypothetical protein
VSSTARGRDPAISLYSQAAEDPIIDGDLAVDQTGASQSQVTVLVEKIGDAEVHEKTRGGLLRAGVTNFR